MSAFSALSADPWRIFGGFSADFPGFGSGVECPWAPDPRPGAPNLATPERPDCPRGRPPGTPECQKSVTSDTDPSGSTHPRSLRRAKATETEPRAAGTVLAVPLVDPRQIAGIDNRAPWGPQEACPWGSVTRSKHLSSASRTIARPCGVGCFGLASRAATSSERRTRSYPPWRAGRRGQRVTPLTGLRDGGARSCQVPGCGIRAP